MSSLTGDFVKNRKDSLSRYRRFALLAVVILAVISTAVFGGIYLYPKVKNFANKKAVTTAKANSGRLPEVWLLQHFRTPNENIELVGGPDGDPDGDNLTNVQEYIFLTNPTKADTDNDGLPDGNEVAFGMNPNGEGDLQAPLQAEEYLKQLGPEYAEFSKENIQKQVESLFNPKQAVLIQLPDDKELKLTEQNDVASIEKYYNETQNLSAAEEGDPSKIETSLFDMSAEELDLYVAKLQATIKVLKDTPVPSQIVSIHKLKIAQLLAGVRMIELVRNTYKPNEENKQFWSDFFGQVVTAGEANQLELLAWGELGKKLQDEGGLPDE